MNLKSDGFSATVQAVISIRHLESMDAETRYKLIGEAFFLCPVVFGSATDQRKFRHPMAYWLTQGCMAHVVRDKFTSGGRESLDGVDVPQIVYRAGVVRRDDIIRASETVTDKQIMQFWEVATPPSHDKRIHEWLQHVLKYFAGTRDEFHVLEGRFI